ncbi:MAG: hypothetical protein U9N46_13410 [Euryarchaeota archaeon]|nr:MAG: hypothetical protein C5S47_00810 [ANME-2 cluster archaeon]MEA1866163.1 hypothetical protein [Euryarchaeota archaeon]
MGQEETKLSSQDIWALFRGTDRMFRETREQIAQMNRQVGGLTGKWGGSWKG